MKHFYNFIDGKFSEKIKKSRLKLSPYEHAEQFSYSDSDFLDVVASVQTANVAQKKWQETSFQSRKLILERFAELILESFKDFVQIDCEDSGIPVEDANHLLRLAHQSFLKLIQLEPGSQNIYDTRATEYQMCTSVGIVGVIVGHEQAILHILENLAVSLSCANLVILHPHESSIRLALKLAELALAAGLPSGALNVILGSGDDLAQNIVEHPSIKHIRFYGSNSLGEKLYKSAVENNKRLFMSLGANNAAIIFSDCNLTSVVSDVLSLALRFHFYGRNKVSRILIQEKCYPDFKTEFRKQIESPNLKIGPLPGEIEKAKFESYQLQSKKDRAKVLFSELTFSTPHGGFHVQPMIFEDLTNCSTLHQEDLVGPIIFLQTFKYAHELGKVLNAGAFAHRAYIWTDDQVRFQKLAQQVEASEIFLNFQSAAQSELSHTTFKSSGLGSEGHQAMFQFNLHQKVIRMEPLRDL
jgi:acyl-CoA reductase-like NAD-dependent aldehyde dehydrogenase